MTVKNCLLVGCGSKFGLEMLEYLMELGYTINLISGSGVKYKHINHLQIDWKTLNVSQIEKFLITIGQKSSFIDILKIEPKDIPTCDDINILFLNIFLKRL